MSLAQGGTQSFVVIVSVFTWLPCCVPVLVKVVLQHCNLPCSFNSSSHGVHSCGIVIVTSHFLYFFCSSVLFLVVMKFSLLFHVLAFLIYTA